MTEWTLPIVTMPTEAAPLGVRQVPVFPELRESPVLYAPPDWTDERIADVIGRLRKAAGLEGSGQAP